MRRAGLLLTLTITGCSKRPGPTSVQPQDTVETHPRPKTRRMMDPPRKQPVPQDKGQVPTK